MVGHKLFFVQFDSSNNSGVLYELIPGKTITFYHLIPYKASSFLYQLIPGKASAILHQRIPGKASAVLYLLIPGKASAALYQLIPN